MEVNGYKIKPKSELLGADLSSLDLEFSNLAGANLKQANLIFSSLSYSELSGALFCEADLYRTDLSNSKCNWANFDQCEANESVFENADLSNASFEGAELSGSNFSGVCLEAANLRGANLENAVFANANLNFADLTGANLSGAVFNQATMSSAKLVGSNMTGAYLIGTDCTNSDARGAILSKTVIGRFDHPVYFYNPQFVDELPSDAMHDALVADAMLSDSKPDLVLDEYEDEIMSVLEGEFPNFVAANFFNTNLKGVNLGQVILLGDGGQIDEDYASRTIFRDAIL